MKNSNIGLDAQNPQYLLLKPGEIDKSTAIGSALKYALEGVRESRKRHLELQKTEEAQKHAEEIQHIISQYFLTQRVKLIEKKDDKAHKIYFEHLSLCHEILVYTMKTKQTTDLSNVEKLKSAVKVFRKSYFKAKAKQ